MDIWGQEKSGHRIGTYFASNIHTYAYIPIPKNASSWATSYFQDILGWKRDTDEAIRQLDNKNFKYWSNLKNHKKIVILQDPVERWMRGVSQFISKAVTRINIDNDELINLLIRHVDFDDHTLPQVNFIHNLDTDDIDFFRLDNNLESNLNKYLSEKIPNEHVVIPNDLYKNSTTDIDPKYFLQNKLKSIIDNDFTVKQHIADYYWGDYMLINSIKFYGT
jgi:hypothetical protein